MVLLLKFTTVGVPINQMVENHLLKAEREPWHEATLIHSTNSVTKIHISTIYFIACAQCQPACLFISYGVIKTGGSLCC